MEYKGFYILLLTFFKKSILKIVNFFIMTKPRFFFFVSITWVMYCPPAVFLDSPKQPDSQDHHWPMLTPAYSELRPRGIRDCQQGSLWGSTKAVLSAGQQLRGTQRSSKGRRWRKHPGLKASFPVGVSIGAVEGQLLGFPQGTCPVKIVTILREIQH